jgi:microcystin-dependent protein
MSDPFVAEVRMLGCNFAPRGWALCDGQLMPISQNTALFSLVGTYYGGDGKSTFALPNLQGSAPLHAGQGPGLSERFLGETGGEGTVTLSTQEVPPHQHAMMAVALARGVSGDSLDPTDNVLAPPASGSAYIDAGNLTAMAADNLIPVGTQGPHNNMQPFLTINFCIALQGVFPPRG